VAEQREIVTVPSENNESPLTEVRGRVIANYLFLGRKYSIRAPRPGAPFSRFQNRPVRPLLPQ
jgi:hypothetical protein